MTSESEEFVFTCTECNSLVGENDNFCTNCGADLSETIYEDESTQFSFINIENFVSLNSKSAWLMALLGITVIICLTAVFADLSQINLVQKVISGYGISKIDAAENDSRIQIITLFKYLAIITSGVLFLIWKNRAYKNLEPLNVFDREYSSGWAVGAYFVPIFNLFKPFQIMREIWKGSDPNFISNNHNENISWKIAPTNSIVPLWWALLLTESFFDNLSYFISREMNTLQQIKTYAFIALISDIFKIAFAIILILLVDKLNNKQNDKYMKLISYNNY